MIGSDDMVWARGELRFDEKQWRFCINYSTAIYCTMIGMD